MSAHPGLPTQYQEITTDGLPSAERFGFWHAACLKIVEPIDVPAGGYGGFRGRSQRLTSGGGSFIDNAVTPMTVQRTQRLCARDGIDGIGVSLEIGGGGTGRIGAADTSVAYAPGDLHILDFAQPFLAHWCHGTHRGLRIDLPRGIVMAAIGRRRRDLTGIVLPPDGLAPLLAAQMRSLAELLPGLNGAHRATALQATIDLAIAVLCLELGAAKPDSDICEDGLLAAAQALINRHFASDRLSPELIAARLGCSRAHLYRLFARHDMTVAGYIREIRLQHARTALHAASRPRDTIGDIAFRCGFASPTHFTRLFTQRFGVRPREARLAPSQAGDPKRTVSPPPPA